MGARRWILFTCADSDYPIVRLLLFIRFIVLWPVYVILLIVVLKDEVTYLF